MSPTPGRLPRRLLCGLLMAGVSAADATTPLGVNVPIFYLVPLLIVFLFEPVPIRVAATAAASAATLVGLSWDAKWDGVSAYGLLNRVFDVGVFGVALALSVRDARRTQQIRALRRALEDSSVVSTADAGGTLRQVNDRFCAISGYPREELTGGSHRLVEPDAHPAEFVQDLWDTIGAGRVWHGEMQRRARDGSLYWVDSTIVPLLDGRGRPYQYLSILHDISAQKHAEARLRSQEALVKIGEMAAIVAHEVRNPVAGVRAALQLFARRPGFTADERAIVRQMMERLDLLEVHVTALVRFASPRPARMKALALQPLLQEAATALRETDGCAAVSCRIAGPDARVLGDAAMLREVFTRLLMNAGEAQDGAGAIAVTVTENGGTVSVSIADHGPGIPAALRARVFEPLFTTKPAAIGIGLSLSKQLVELHAGELEVVQTSPLGTTVRVGLPRAV